MIGYDIVVSLVGVYIAAKTSPVENFKHRCKIGTVVNMVTHFARRGGGGGGVSGGQVSWAASNPWTRKLASGELQFDGFHLFIYGKKSILLLPPFPCCLPYQPVHFVTVV